MIDCSLSGGVELGVEGSSIVIDVGIACFFVHGRSSKYCRELKRLSYTDFHLRPLGLQRLGKVSDGWSDGQAKKSVGNFRGRYWSASVILGLTPIFPGYR